MRSSLPFTLVVSLLSLPCAGQRASRPHAVDRPHSAPHEAAPASRASDLPVTHVSLYKNGIGFFEHAGHITGDSTVTLDLTSAQLNDVLQTLTAIDLGGGHITGANYNSTTPLEQQLGALPLSLGDQPTQQDLYASLRGARVEVTGSGPAFSGRILSLEVRTAPAAANEAKPAPEHRVLTVISDSGVARTLDLTPITSVRLDETALRSELNDYLELLDRNRSDGIRHLTLTDRGTGTRDLRVSFLSEVPVWKSTYRLLLTAQSPAESANPPSSMAKTSTLQGFSVVDNTTGEDWRNVQLSLIAGNPQSFLQPLAQPIYNRRPEIPIAENAQLAPQTHDSAVDELHAPAKLPRELRMLKQDGAPPPEVAGVAGMSGMAGGVMGGIGSANATVSVDAPAPLIPYETAAANSTAPNATTAAFDDFFAYNLAEPVTIPRNGSALVPILQTQLPTESVTLWSPSQPTPLRALWLTNNSSLTLDRGSFSVIENGAFAGEGLLETVHPGERRLLSYAADQAVRVSVDSRQDTQRLTTVAVAKGVLHATNSEIARLDYLVDNAAPDQRTIIVEQPRRLGWTLDPDAKPAETTPTAYRFRVDAKPHETVHVPIGERRTLDQYFRLADADEDQLTILLRHGNASPALLQQLEPVFTARRVVSNLDRQINEKQTAVNQLVEDQKRLRDNLAALKSTAEERSLAKRYTAELNTQEDTLANLRRDLTSLRQQSTAAQADLAGKIDSLQIESQL